MISRLRNSNRRDSVDISIFDRLATTKHSALTLQDTVTLAIPIDSSSRWNRHVLSCSTVFDPTQSQVLSPRIPSAGSSATSSASPITSSSASLQSTLLSISLYDFDRIVAQHAQRYVDRVRIALQGEIASPTTSSSTESSKSLGTPKRRQSLGKFVDVQQLQQRHQQQRDHKPALSDTAKASHDLTLQFESLRGFPSSWHVLFHQLPTASSLFSDHSKFRIESLIPLFRWMERTVDSVSLQSILHSADTRIQNLDSHSPTLLHQLPTITDPKHILLSEGQPFDQLFLIVSGSVALFKSLDVTTSTRWPTSSNQWSLNQHTEHRQVHLCTLSAGHIIGSELILPSITGANFTAILASPHVQLLSIDRQYLPLILNPVTNRYLVRHCNMLRSFAVALGESHLRMHFTRARTSAVSPTSSPAVDFPTKSGVSAITASIRTMTKASSMSALPTVTLPSTRAKLLLASPSSASPLISIRQYQLRSNFDISEQRRQHQRWMELCIESLAQRIESLDVNHELDSITVNRHADALVQQHQSICSLLELVS